MAADNLVTLSRYREFLSSTVFRANFDAEAVDLGEAFFGFNPLAQTAQPAPCEAKPPIAHPGAPPIPLGDDRTPPV